MKALINVLLVIVVVVFIAVVVFLIRTSGSDDKTAQAEPTDKPIVYMGTGGVVDNIERRLEARTGRDLRIKCPEKVDEAIGTTFRCSVRYVGLDDIISKAAVKIDGPGGEFSWKSESVVKAP